MVELTPGDPAPIFAARATNGAPFRFVAAAGRYVVLCFFGSAREPATAAMLQSLWRRSDVFQGEHAAFLAVSCDPDDERLGRVQRAPPGFEAIWDFDRAVAATFGVSDPATSGGNLPYRRMSLILDTTLRVLAVLPIRDPAKHAERVADYVARLPALPRGPASLPAAPVLVVPRVFEAGFCRSLIELYERHGGFDSGYMATDPETGKTVGVIDHAHKRRRDYSINEREVRLAIRERIVRRLIPEIRRVFQFKVTQIERYLIACYDAGEGGHFRPHRDNTTKGTAHRRFAVTINLNAGEYVGGDLRFPEYDWRTYRAPTGGAVVFSCSLMHEATTVTEGKRYCVLPFLYDDAAERIRLANLQFVESRHARRAAASASAAEPAPAGEAADPPARSEE